MDKRLVREFRERYDAVAAIEAEEQRTATLEVRWQQLNSIFRLARELGLTHCRRRLARSRQQHCPNPN